MTREEAIKFNTALQMDLIQKGMPTFAKAVGIGIEALKLVEEGRFRGLINPDYLLPGETKD